MTAKPNDPLLLFGRMLAVFLQGASALGAGIVLIMVPVLALASQDKLPESLGLDGLEILEASPLSVIAICVMLALICAALFAFFGKMRRIIVSVGEGDPFIAQNAERLSSMAWLLLLVQGLAVIVGFVRLYLANLVSGEAEQVTFSVYDLKGLVMVLVLFILARVFRHGAAMRADLEGTV